ncbi:hypothetical protein [Neolewinella antarctica]|uniref:Uncharacterized protein n=1 Tax=Neolewinella antarctica TaxID=442734 RepID=A0ABX0X6F3_9BACT|nr:hypothetical protein [Neolewinella antarctica]NJC24804.1 hypothetical protein [Neolewinella antarctica]
MGALIKGGFFHDDVGYDVFLDRGGPGDTFIKTPITSVRLDYKLDKKSLTSNIFASKLTVSWMVDKGNYREEQLLRTQSNPEGTYILRVLREGELWWMGYVLPGQSTRPLWEEKYEITIAATDGIGRLKGVDYLGGGVEPLKDHLLRCLTDIPLPAGYYGPDDVFMSFNSLLVPDGVTPSDQFNLSGELKLNSKALRSVDDRGRVENSSAYDALVQFLRVTGARVVQANGRWWVTENSGYATNVRTLYHHYAIDGTYLGVSNQGGLLAISKILDTDDATVSAGAQVRSQSPVRRAEVTYTHFTLADIAQEELNVDRNVARIEGFGGGGTLHIRARVNMKNNVRGLSTAALDRIVNTTVIVEVEGQFNWYLHRDATPNAGGVSLGAAEWRQETGSYQSVVSNPPPSLTIQASGRINFYTPPVPDGGTLVVSFGSGSTYQAGQQSNVSTNVSFTDLRIADIPAGNADRETNAIVYAESNQAYDLNSGEEDFEVNFGDGPGENTFGTLKILQGRLTKKTSGWRAYWTTDGGESFSHGAVLAKMIMGLRSQTNEEITGTIFTGKYSANQLVLTVQGDPRDVRNIRKYVPVDLSHNLLTGAVRGSWVEVSFAWNPNPGNTSEIVLPPHKTNGEGPKSAPPESKDFAPPKGGGDAGGNDGGGGQSSSSSGLPFNPAINAWDASGAPLSRLGDPVDPADAVTLRYLQQSGGGGGSDGWDSTKPILRMPKVGDIVTGFAWFYFTPPTVRLTKSPSTTLYEWGTVNTLSINVSTNNPGAATLGAGRLEANGSEVFSWQNNASPTYAFQFEPGQGGGANGAADYSFRARLDYSEGDEPTETVSSNSQSIRGVYPVFVGVTDAILTAGTSVYTALTKAIVNQGDLSQKLTGSGHIYYAYPTTWAANKSLQIIDGNGFDVTAGFEVTTVAVTSVDLPNNWTQNYKVFRLRNTTTINNTTYEFRY